MKYIDIIRNLDGWCSEDKSTKLYNLIIFTKPLYVVEIGVFGGKSLISQAFALRDNGSGKIIGIDSWSKDDCISGMTNQVAIDWWSTIDYDQIYSKCVSAIDKNNLTNYVELYKMSSHNCADSIKPEIDILHIDGNHEDASACRDVELYLPKVKCGGYVWFDDANWYQTRNAIALIETKYNCTLLDKAKSDDPNNFCSLYKKI